MYMRIRLILMNTKNQLTAKLVVKITVAYQLARRIQAFEQLTVKVLSLSS